MAAEHALITAVAAAGDHVVIPDDLYGGTYRLVDKVLNRWGLQLHDGRPDRPRRRRGGGHRRHEADLGRDADQPDAQGGRHRGDRRPQARRARGGRQHVRHARLPAPAGARRRRRPCTRPRSTSAGTRTPSAARWSSGRPRCTTRCKFVQNSVGAVPGPLDCFLVHRGIRTLHLRMAAHSENARAVSEWLADGRRRERRPLARLLRHGLLPPPGRDADRRRHARCSRSPSRSAASSR